MKLKKRTWIFIGIGVLLLVLLIGFALLVILDDDAATPSYMPYGVLTDGAAYDVSYEADMPVAAMRASGSANSGDSDALPDIETRKIVRKASMTLRTKAFEEAGKTITDAVNQHGGYVESLYETGEVGYRRIELALRVPSDRLDAFLSALSGAGRVTNRNESATDMTTQYQDNAGRLDTLYAKRKRLLALLEMAGEMSDLIEVESAIADTQYEIDRYETRQREIDKNADMSRVDVTLQEEKPAETAQADEPLWERMKAGFVASIEGLGAFLEGLAVFVTMAIPVAVPLAAIVLIVRALRKRSKQKRAKEQEER